MSDITIVARYLDQHCAAVPGLRTRYAELHAAFLSSLPPSQRASWSRRRFGDALAALGVERAKGPSGQVECANLVIVAHVCQVHDGRLVVVPI
jgi:hypothetical protein